MADGPSGSADGTGRDAHFFGPRGVAFDGSGIAYVADYENHTIRKVTPAGVVTALAGSPGVWGSADGVESGARFSYPVGVAVDGSSNVYVADYANHSIRKVTPGGVVTTISGQSGTPGYAEGVGSSARFNYPSGICFGTDSNLYVADTNNHVIRKITLGGVALTSLFAGVPSTAGWNDGSVLTAKFNLPKAVVQDGAGTVFVASCGEQAAWDSTNHKIRLIAGGSVGTLAGTDSAGTVAEFYSINGLALQPGTGHLLVTDFGRVRRVRPDSVVTTVAGSTVCCGGGPTDGTGVFAQFNNAFGIAVSPTGAICISDAYNNAVRRAFRAPATDFDGNSYAEIVWHNTTTGDVYLYYMGGTGGYTVLSGGGVPGAPTVWTIEGVADLNADGQPDLLWRNKATGEVYIYYLGGAAGNTFLTGAGIPGAPTVWEMVGP